MRVSWLGARAILLLLYVQRNILISSLSFKILRLLCAETFCVVQELNYKKNSVMSMKLERNQKCLILSRRGIYIEKRTLDLTLEGDRVEVKEKELEQKLHPRKDLYINCEGFKSNKFQTWHPEIIDGRPNSKSTRLQYFSSGYDSGHLTGSFLFFCRFWASGCSLSTYS